MSRNEASDDIILSFDYDRGSQYNSDTIWRVWNNHYPMSIDEAIMCFNSDTVWLGGSATGIPVARYRGEGVGMIWLGSEMGSPRVYDMYYMNSISDSPIEKSKKAIASLVKVLAQTGKINIENKPIKGSLWRGEEIKGEPFARYHEGRAWFGGEIKDPQNADACSYQKEVWFGANETGAPIASYFYGYEAKDHYFKYDDSIIRMDNGKVILSGEGKNSETIARYDTQDFCGVASAVVLLLSEMQKEQEEDEAEKQRNEDLIASVKLVAFKIVVVIFLVLFAWLWGKLYPTGVNETTYVMGAVSFFAIFYFFNVIKTFLFVVGAILIPIISGGVTANLHNALGSYLTGVVIIIFGLCWIFSWLGSFSGGGGGSSSDVTVTIRKDRDSKVKVRVRNK